MRHVVPQELRPKGFFFVSVRRRRIGRRGVGRTSMSFSAAVLPTSEPCWEKRECEVVFEKEKFSAASAGNAPEAGAGGTRRRAREGRCGR